jgi:hypothetical protein
MFIFCSTLVKPPSALTSQSILTAMRKQRPFADGWRKINVPTLDDAGDDDQIVLYVRRRSC